MEQLTEFFQGIFSTDDWPARWFCGYWSEFHGWLYIISDLMIWLCYFAIPGFILAFLYKKKDVPLPRVFWLFGAFILACGLTHFIDAVIFWWPAYRLSALIRFATACISVATVIALVKFFPKALNLTTSAEFNREITRRKAAEEKLKLLNHELSTKNDEIQQFAYIASHDLQEPLRTVKGMVDIMQKSYADKLDEDAISYFNFMTDSTERMQRLISGLLDYSRLGQDPVLEKINTDKLVQEVLLDLKTKISESGAQIEIGPMPELTGYSTELRLLFQNLIHNAIKFVKDGVEPKIIISSREDEHFWEFSVKDNGLGIKEKHLKKIFAIFQQLNHRSKFGGSGLGLAHCKKIAEMHHGKIWAESEFDNGTTFYFTISKEISQ